MYYQGALPYLNSCLRETLINAFTRFSQLDICTLKEYESGEGPSNIYLKSPPSKRDKFLQYYFLLEGMSSCAGNSEKLKIVELEVTEAVKLSGGPHKESFIA